LIELLTGTHPYYLPEPLRLSERYGPDYAGFVFTLPEPMARCLDHRARYLLRHAGIDEPVTWEPPFDWVTGIAWPGPHPDNISADELHPLIQAGLPVRVAAARLGTSIEHVRLTATRHPAPKVTASTTAQASVEPNPPGTGLLRKFAQQGFGPRKIARITGCSERVIRQLLTSAGLRQPAQRPHPDIDPQWLREQYHSRQRSLKDIAAETGIPVDALAAATRNAGIPVRQGVNGHAHPGQPRRARRVPASDLGRLRPPSRRAAHPQDPHAPQAAQPPACRPRDRHQARHPDKPDPPARRHHRHHAPAHRPGRDNHPDR
jgi:hypothetical protein